MSSIRTPDQRLRVFISSTIEELKEERRSLCEAIGSLRLTPVYFEAGARPHPPRELYRAYLGQSDIFIGVYAKSYGWVAPDMSISGLEDEYRSSGDRPKLIYIKEIEGERDARLNDLLNDIRNSGSMSYQKFRTPEQLAELLRNDIALLLSERFGGETGPPARVFTLPAIRSATVGREEERARIAELIMRPDTGLVTLTGTGGTGKSHLALRVAHDVAPRFADGAAFVALASVQRPEQVVPAIASAVGVLDNGQGDPLGSVVTRLAGRQVLLVIDNFEHVLDAAPQLTELLARLPKLMLLVTSRAPLHLSGEQVFPVPPLLPPSDQESGTERLLANAAVDLFVQRARARAAQLTLDGPNVRAIAELCRRLEGLPLAIELAAAHTKYFSPLALEARMVRMLDLLDRGPRDLPERQRTMRTAIASSYELLDGAHRAFFRKLSVFNERWTIDAAAAVTDPVSLGIDALAALELLTDAGLVRVAPTLPNDPGFEPRFAMLHVLREFAGEELDAHDERTSATERLKLWCKGLVDQGLAAAGSDAVFPWMDRVEASYADLRAVILEALAKGDVPTVWYLVAQLNSFWLLRGCRSEALEWLYSTGLDRLRAEPDFAAGVPAMLRGSVLLAASAMGYFDRHLGDSVQYLRRALELFEEPGTPPFLPFYAQLFLGLTHTGSGEVELAAAAFDAALERSRILHDEAMEALCRCYRMEVHLRQGDVDRAHADVVLSERVAERTGRRLLTSSVRLAKGNMDLSLGNYQDAVTSFGQCIRIDSELRVMGTLGWAQNGLGFCLLQLGRLEEGERTLRDGLSNARQSGYRAMLMAQWAGLALLASMRGDHGRAARIFGAAEHVRTTIRYSPWMATRVVMDTTRRTIEEALAPDLLKREMESGARLAPEDVDLLTFA